MVMSLSRNPSAPGTFAVFAQCAAICLGSILVHWCPGEWKKWVFSLVGRCWKCFALASDSIFLFLVVSFYTFGLYQYLQKDAFWLVLST